MLSKARLEFVFKNEAAAESADKALASESGFNRAGMKLKRENNRLFADVRADDVTALRAYVNGVLRALQAIESIENDIPGEEV
jgi:tRNA threonylcarbamoyladenosine modification (KEOPS) complex  Pcc1 subunit